MSSGADLFVVCKNCGSEVSPYITECPYCGSRLRDRMREHAQDLGSAAELEPIEDLLAHGNGASRQVVVYEANHDLREVVGEIIDKTSA